MKKIFPVFALVSASFISNASEVVLAKITEVRSGPWYGELVTFKVNPAPESPSCNTLGDRGHYVINLSKPGANAWFSMILAAKASQSEVQVWGTGSCVSVNGFNGEELQTIAVKL